MNMGAERVASPEVGSLGKNPGQSEQEPPTTGAKLSYLKGAHFNWRVKASNGALLKCFLSFPGNCGYPTGSGIKVPREGWTEPQRPVTSFSLLFEAGSLSLECWVNTMILLMFIKESIGHILI